jgi:hypothetical protein
MRKTVSIRKNGLIVTSGFFARKTPWQYMAISRVGPYMEVACTMLQNGIERNTVVKMNGLA